jgi:hypothetical protein
LKKPVLRICHLYPDLLNLYGDRGNILALIYRAKMRGIDSEVLSVTIDQKYEVDQYDITFFGGGQDAEQNLIRRDLVNEKGEDVRSAVQKNKVFLCICGGYQMMGRYYQEHKGKKITCLEAIDIFTVGDQKRMIGNTVYHSEMLSEAPILYGFENHSGRTYLGEGVRPLAKTIIGYGNNGEDGTEGAIHNNVYCTYSHGSFLPKNPAMTDHLIETALQQKLGASYVLEVADADIEGIARSEIESCKRG